MLNHWRTGRGGGAEVGRQGSQVLLTGRVSDDSPTLLDAGRLVQRVQQVPDLDVLAELEAV